jgi:hypothetical protein
VIEHSIQQSKHKINEQYQIQMAYITCYEIINTFSNPQSTTLLDDYAHHYTTYAVLQISMCDIKQFLLKKCINNFITAKTDWFRTRIMCQSGATSLPAYCCFSKLALIKIKFIKSVGLLQSTSCLDCWMECSITHLSLVFHICDYYLVIDVYCK